MMALIQKFKKYIENIEPKDKIALIHDTDPDGICSAVITAKAIEKIKNKKIAFRTILTDKTLTRELRSSLNKKGITKLIVLDISLEQQIKDIEKLSKKIDVLIIDHHKIYSKKKLKNLLIVKPQLISKIKPHEYCTAKLTYDLFSEIQNIEELDWLAGIASIADIAHKPWMNWLRKVLRKYNFGMRKDLFKTKLGKIASMISSAEVLDQKNVKKCYEILYSAKRPKQAITKELKNFKKIIDKELKRLIRLFKKVKPYGSLYIFDIDSKIPQIKSPLSTILGLKYPHRTIMIVSRQKPNMRVSGRRGDRKVAVNNLLEKAVKGLPQSNAGGHVPSAGAKFLLTDYPLFKARLIEEHDKLNLL